MMPSIKKSDLYFPSRTLIIVLLVIILPVVYLLTRLLAQGYVQFESSVPGAFIVDERQEVLHKTPVTLKKSAGRHPMTFSAPGFGEKHEKVVFPTLFLSRTITFKLDKKLYSEENPDSFKRIPLGDRLPHFEESQFQIDLPNEAGIYPVSLLSNRNWYDSDNAYKVALRADKKATLAWIKTNGIDPEKLKYQWIPFDPE